MPGIEAAMERFSVLEAGGQRSETGGQMSGSAATDTASSVRTDATSGGSNAEARASTRKARALSPENRDHPPALAEPAADTKAQNSVTSPPSSPAKPTEDGTDTRAAAADGEEQRATTEDGESADKPSSNGNRPSSPGKTRYAKAQERLEKTWDAVNRRKDELDARTAALEQQRLAFERDKAQFDAVRRQAEKPEHTPEQYAQAAQLKRRDADALRMQSRRAGEAGRMAEAQKLAKQADKAEGLADDLAEYAERLKTNPPPGLAQRVQLAEQARQYWTLEAAKAFPDLARGGSRLQQVVVQHANALAKDDPQLLAHPSLIYHLSRLADLQLRAKDLQAAAARVPALEKDAEKLRTRIKELEASTSPAADGGVSKIGGKPADDYASLRNEAQSVGAIFG